MSNNHENTNDIMIIHMFMFIVIVITTTIVIVISITITIVIVTIARWRRPVSPRSMFLCRCFAPLSRTLFSRRPLNTILFHDFQGSRGFSRVLSSGQMRSTIYMEIATTRALRKTRELAKILRSFMSALISRTFAWTPDNVFKIQATHMLYMYVYIYIYIHIHTYIIHIIHVHKIPHYSRQESELDNNNNNVHIYIYIYIYTCVCMHIHMYIYI